MVDEVRREIKRIQGYISNGRLTQFDEANTKATAIEPILRELGWDVVDPDEVRREYSVGSRSVDYALFCDDTLKVFIEAKKEVNCWKDIKSSFLIMLSPKVLKSQYLPTDQRGGFTCQSER